MTPIDVTALVAEKLVALWRQAYQKKPRLTLLFTAIGIAIIAFAAYEVSIVAREWLSVTSDDAGFPLHTALVAAINRTSHGHSRRA